EDDLLDRAIPAFGCQRLTGGRVPAVNRAHDGARQRLAAVGEHQAERLSVNVPAFFPAPPILNTKRLAGGGDRLAIRREGHAAASHPPLAVLRERFQFL